MLEPPINHNSRICDNESIVVEPEWEEWYRLTPIERWEQSELLWQYYLSIGGSLDPEPDPESPFFDAGARYAGPADGWTGVRVLRRGGV